MVEDNGENEDKFEFDYAGEARGYISLDQARVLAMRTAMEAPGAYGRRFQGVPMAFDVVEETDTEDHYVITLSFRPQGEFSGTPGQEQFYIEKEGTVAVRQIRGHPRPEGGRRLPVLVIVVGLVLLIAGAGVGAVFAAGGFGGGEVEKPAPFGLIPTLTMSPASTPVTGGIVSGQPGAAGYQPLGVLASVPADRVQCARDILGDEPVRELKLGIRLPDPNELDKIQHCFPQGFPRELLEPSPPVSALLATLAPGQVDCVRQALSLGAVSDFVFGFRQPTGEEIDQIRHCFPEGIPIELKDAGVGFALLPSEQVDCIRNAIGDGPLTDFSQGKRGPNNAELEAVQHCFPGDPVEKFSEALAGLIILPFPADVSCVVGHLGEPKARQIGIGGRQSEWEEVVAMRSCLPEEVARELLSGGPTLSFEADLLCVIQSLNMDNVVQMLGPSGRQPTGDELDKIRHCLPGEFVEGQPQPARSVFGLQLAELNCVRDTLGRAAITETSLGIRGPDDQELESISHCFDGLSIDGIRDQLKGLIVLRYEADVECVVVSVGERIAREIGIGGRPATIEEAFAIQRCLPEHSIRAVVEESVVLSFDADKLCVVKALNLDVGTIQELGPNGRLPGVQEFDAIQHCLAPHSREQILGACVNGHFPDSDLGCIVGVLGEEAVRQWGPGGRLPSAEDIASVQHCLPDGAPAELPESIATEPEPTLAPIVVAPTSIPTPEPVLGDPTPVPGGGLTRGGTISGTLKDGFTGDPIPDVEIWAELDVGGFRSNGYTDSTGTYAIVGLPEGVYRIMAGGVEHLGYLSGFYRDTQRWEEAELVTVGPGEAVTSIDFTLGTGAIITGLVIDRETSLPMSNVQVDANEEQIGVASGARTDFNGRYELRGLGAGRYRVQARVDDGQYADEYYDGKVAWDNADIITIFGREEITGVDFTLGAAATITGRVTDQETGFPVSNIEVNANLVDGGFGAGDRTNFDGRYALRGLGAGTYRIRARSEDTGYVEEFYNDKLGWDNADFVTVGQGEEVANIDFGLSRGATISGIVIDGDTGQPISDTEVYANFLDRGYGICCANTDSNGVYSLRGVPEGAVEVVVASQVYLGQGLEVRIDGPGEVPGVNFTLFTGASISGWVFDADTGEPLASASIDAQLDGGRGGFGAGTDEEGRYTLQALPPGRYVVQAELRSEGYSSTYFNDKLTYDRADVIVIAGREDVRDVDIGLRIGGTISGRIMDVATGLPVVGVGISASHEETGAWVSIRTDSDGRYVLRDLGSGRHRIQFSPEMGYVVQFFRNQPSYDRADLVVISDRGDVIGIDFGLVLGANVSGSIVDGATGLPIRGMEVRARSNGNDVAWGTTDSEGTYLLEAIPDGEIEIFVYGQGYLEQSRFITVSGGCGRAGG